MKLLDFIAFLIIVIPTSILTMMMVTFAVKAIMLKDYLSSFGFAIFATAGSVILANTVWMFSNA